MKWVVFALEMGFFHPKIGLLFFSDVKWRFGVNKNNFYTPKSRGLVSKAGFPAPKWRFSASKEQLCSPKRVFSTKMWDFATLPRLFGTLREDFGHKIQNFLAQTPKWHFFSPKIQLSAPGRVPKMEVSNLRLRSLFPKLSFFSCLISFSGPKTEF